MKNVVDRCLGLAVSILLLGGVGCIAAVVNPTPHRSRYLIFLGVAQLVTILLILFRLWRERTRDDT